MDLALVRDTYARMTDAELLQLLRYNAAGLTEQALEIVKEEVSRRGLNPGIIHTVALQNMDYAGYEEAHCRYIQSLPCPECGSVVQHLNGTMTYVVHSIIVVTQTEKRLAVACPDCLDKKIDQAMLTTLKFGWWSFHGFFFTLRALILNFRSRGHHRAPEANFNLKKWIAANVRQVHVSMEGGEISPFTR